MKRFVYQNYPASKFPDDWRGDIDPSSMVTVTIVEEEKRPEKVMTLEEIFALRAPPFRTAEEIDEDLRRDRDEWDD
jgi:hypothetical protein